MYVFDISQTEGEDLPDLDAVRPKLLDGDGPEGIWDALVDHASAAGVEVIRDRRGSANGYCDFLEKRIALSPEYSPRREESSNPSELRRRWRRRDEDSGDRHGD